MDALVPSGRPNVGLGFGDWGAEHCRPSAHDSGLASRGCRHGDALQVFGGCAGLGRRVVVVW